MQKLSHNMPLQYHIMKKLFFCVCMSLNTKMGEFLA